MTTTFKLLYLDQGAGEPGLLPDYGITNMGGVAGSTFTVGGKALLFADGTSTGGGGTGSNTLSLQATYDFSVPATIELTTGKHFTLEALNNRVFQFNADTGKVTITGDLEVLGSSSVVEGVLSNVDQVSINPPNGTTSGLLIEPLVGVTMATDLVRFRVQNAGPAVFSIDQAGNTFIRQLTVGTTLNSVDFNQFYADFNDHVVEFEDHVAPTGIKHDADQIAVDGALSNAPGVNVQEVLESINSAIGTLGASIKTHEHIQTAVLMSWTIVHGQNSRRPTVTIYDANDYQVLPGEVIIVDANTIRVEFSEPEVGRAIILLF